MRARIDPPTELLRLAAAQAGVVTSSQAAAHGLERGVQRRLVENGNWQRLANGILLTRNGDPDWESWAWGGVLRAGDGARLAGRAAAYADRMIDEGPDPIDILQPHGLHRPRTHEWVFHQERAGLRMPSIGSLPRTRIEDTVLDLATTQLGGRRGPGPLHWVTIAIEQRPTTTDRLLAALRRRTRVSGRQELLEILEYAGDGVESPLEYHYVRDVEQAHACPKASGRSPFGSMVGEPGGTCTTRSTGCWWNWTARTATPVRIGSGITDATTRRWYPAMRPCGTAGTTSAGKAAVWRHKWLSC